MPPPALVVSTWWSSSWSSQSSLGGHHITVLYAMYLIKVILFTTKILFLKLGSFGQLQRFVHLACWFVNRNSWYALQFTSGHESPWKRPRRDWHFTFLAARFHCSLGYCLKTWLSVANPVRPFLTVQQREGNIEAPNVNSLGSWKIWRVWSSWEGPCLGPHCSDGTHLNCHPVKRRGQFWCLGIVFLFFF